jgi:hypothetical protein
MLFNQGFLHSVWFWICVSGNPVADGGHLIYGVGVGYLTTLGYLLYLSFVSFLFASALKRFLRRYPSALL